MDAPVAHSDVEWHQYEGDWQTDLSVTPDVDRVKLTSTCPQCKGMATRWVERAPMVTGYVATIDIEATTNESPPDREYFVCGCGQPHTRKTPIGEEAVIACGASWRAKKASAS